VGPAFRVGHALGTGTGTPEFSGVLDEIRISSTPHNNQIISQTYMGTAGSLGLVINRVIPTSLVRGAITEVIVSGYNLANASATLTDANAAVIPTQVIASSATSITIRADVGAGTALGNAQLVLLSIAGNASTNIAIRDLTRSLFGVESDTRLLWHLDETSNGSARIVDVGPLSVDGTAGSTSQAATGRFGGGRTGANILADSDPNSFNAFNFPEGLTAECWVKTGPVTRNYVLVGKNDSGGGSEDFNLVLQPSGSLRGRYVDSSNTVFDVTMPATTFDVDDDQWHYVALVVVPGDKQVIIYVDGVERAKLTSTSTMLGMRNVGPAFRVGHALGTGTGTPEFSGVLDEIRISSTPHNNQIISQTYNGNTSLRVTSYTPKEIVRNRASSQPHTSQVTINGYSMDGVSARVLRDGQ
jgi:hypothetical protein